MFSACCANEERASVAPRLQGAISMGYAQFNACPPFCKLNHCGQVGADP
jgi:hypothetical protein